MNNVYTIEELLALIRRLPKPEMYGQQLRFVRLGENQIRILIDQSENFKSDYVKIHRAIASKHPDNPSELRWLIADIHVIL